jgi:plastocyanin
MKDQRLVTSRLSTAIALAVLAGCSGGSPTDAPADGGSTGGDTSGGAAPPTAAVSVGNNVFTSGHNGLVNPAVDTIAAGGSVTWTWTNAGGVLHSIQSLGSPIFRNSIVKSGDGSTYQVSLGKQVIAASRRQLDTESPAITEGDHGAHVSDEWAWVELNYRPHAYQAI